MRHAHPRAYSTIPTSVRTYHPTPLPITRASSVPPSPREGGIKLNRELTRILFDAQRAAAQIPMSTRLMRVQARHYGRAARH